MQVNSVNRFRQKRGQVLRRQIEKLTRHFQRPIRVLDVGGRADYWANVGLDGIESVTLVNYDADELAREGAKDTEEGSIFTRVLGDARDLSDYDDQSVDLVHSNSVIEHVGAWDDMAAMAREVQRVGVSGWIQTPAWEFPIEPHFRAPFMHWFGAPAQKRMFGLSFDKRIRGLSDEERRRALDSINLLSKAEIRQLFPGRDIYVERILLAKSYSVHWING